LEYRARDYASHEGLSLDAARRVLTELDKERRLFVERQFHVRADDPCQFDLVLNVQTLGLEAARELITTAYRLKFGQIPSPQKP
jgi:cytidylate kinase